MTNIIEFQLQVRKEILKTNTHLRLLLFLIPKLVSNFYYYSYLPSASTINKLYNLNHELNAAELSHLLDMHGDIHS